VAGGEDPPDAGNAGTDGLKPAGGDEGKQCFHSRMLGEPRRGRNETLASGAGAQPPTRYNDRDGWPPAA